MKNYPEKGIEWYINNDFAGGWNQSEVMDSILFLSVTGFIISYTNCPILWMINLQTENALRNIEAKYIELYQSVSNVLPSVSLMKEIEFTIEIQRDSLMDLWFFLIESQYMKIISGWSHLVFLFKNNLVPNTSWLIIVNSIVLSQKLA